VWELLFFGVIPVVQSSALDPMFDGLPVVIVENWRDVCAERFFERAWERVKSRWPPPLQVFTLQHWVVRTTSSVTARDGGTEHHGNLFLPSHIFLSTALTTAIVGVLLLACLLLGAFLRRLRFGRIRVGPAITLLVSLLLLFSLSLFDVELACLPSKLLRRVLLATSVGSLLIVATLLFKHGKLFVTSPLPGKGIVLLA
jgi:hypothetical protein